MSQNCNRTWYAEVERVSGGGDSLGIRESVVAMGTSSCPNCGTEYEAGGLSTLCSVCQEPLPVAAEAPGDAGPGIPGVTRHPCRKCGEGLYETELTCWKCGTVQGRQRGPVAEPPEQSYGPVPSPPAPQPAPSVARQMQVSIAGPRPAPAFAPRAPAMAMAGAAPMGAIAVQPVGPAVGPMPGMAAPSPDVLSARADAILDSNQSNAAAESKASSALTMALLAFLCFPILGPFAIWQAVAAKREGAQGANATIALVLGIMATLAIAVQVVGAMLVVGMMATSAPSMPPMPPAP